MGWRLKGLGEGRGDFVRSVGQAGEVEQVETALMLRDWPYEGGDLGEVWMLRQLLVTAMWWRRDLHLCGQFPALPPPHLANCLSLGLQTWKMIMSICPCFAANTRGIFILLTKDPSLCMT